MKKLLLLTLMVAFTAGISNAQITIFEDFDSYQPGDFIQDVNPDSYIYFLIQEEVQLILSWIFKINMIQELQVFHFRCM